MLHKVLLLCLCTIFVNSSNALETKGLNNFSLVHTTGNITSNGLTGKWTVQSRVRSSLLHGEKSSHKETYKTPVIYDFNTPNVLKVTENGEVSSYKYKIKNNEIIIEWVEHMAIEAMHGPTNYTIKKTGNKMVFLHEVPAASPNYYKVSINLEAVK